jgi:hypothetical protein
MVAVCENIGEEVDSVRFRRHVVVHLPRKDEILRGTDGVRTEGLWRTWTAIGHVQRKEGRFQEAEELEVKVMEVRSSVLGEEHPDTLITMVNLAY